MKHALNDRFARSLVVPRSGQLIYWDQNLRRFGLRLSQGGARAWLVQYRTRDGKSRKIKIGDAMFMSCQDARNAAMGILAKVAQGSDPQAERQAERGSLRWGDLTTMYLSLWARPEKRSWRLDERRIKRNLAEWDQRRVSEITRSDCFTVLDRIVQRGAPIEARRTQALISRIINFGIDRSLLPEGFRNPADKLKVGRQETPRQRVLSESEIKALWNALDVVLKPKRAAIFRMALLTGARAREVYEMKWCEIDLESATWTLPGSRTKNGVQHSIPLSSTALSILKARQGASDFNPVFVFPGQRADQPLCCHEAKFMRALYEAMGSDGWTFHDLRRTAATHMARLGVAENVISRLLNHTSKTITGRIYALYGFETERRAALQQWADEIARIAGVPTAPHLRLVTAA